MSQQDDSLQPVETLQLVEKRGLADSTVSDGELVTTRLFNSLTEDDKPLVPLPPDEAAGLKYPQFLENRCQICKSPYRDLAEHVYISSGKRVAAVQNFFAKHFAAKVYYEPVKHHMENHCDLSKIAVSGLKTYELRDDEIAKWKYNLFDLSLTALLVELDDVRGMVCKTPDLKIKRASMVERLTGRILALKEQRDEVNVSFDIFTILSNIIQRLPHEECKQVVLAIAKELREQLADK